MWLLDRIRAEVSQDPSWKGLFPDPSAQLHTEGLFHLAQTESVGEEYWRYLFEFTGEVKSNPLIIISCLYDHTVYAQNKYSKSVRATVQQVAKKLTATSHVCFKH